MPSNEEIEALQELMEEVADSAEAGESIGAFYAGIRKRVEADVALEITKYWMWHKYPLIDEDEEEEGA